MKIIPLILSGGSGSRLWPVSRTARPKQFLSLSDDHAMIAGTARRVHEVELFHPPMVIAGAEHRFLVMDALDAAGCPPSQVLLEPCGRNTAAAIAVGALYLAEKDPETIVLAMPSDHTVRDEAAFRAAIRQAIAAAQSGHIVTFGIKASRPDTGYGYIQRGESLNSSPRRGEVGRGAQHGKAEQVVPLPPTPSGFGGRGPNPLPQAGEGIFTIKRFCEKPDTQTAQTYLDSGDYYWNSGIFLFKVQTVIEEMQALCPEIMGGVRRALGQSQHDLGFIRLDPDAFAALPSIPFDIAVMEKTAHGAVLPVEFGWSDVGSWRSLWEIMPQDTSGNAGKGDTKFLGSHNCLAWSAPGMLTAVVGLENVAIIVTDDAILAMDKNRAEEVREVVDYLKSARRSEHALSSKVYRPWGYYQTIDKGKGYLVKRLEIKPGARLSLQYHNHRAEHWTVVEGTATITRDKETFDLESNASTYIAKGMKHRLENRQATPLILIEVQSGDRIDEDDIVRLEDNYGRV